MAYESPEYETVRNALYHLEDMHQSEENPGFLIRAFLGYKGLEKELEPLLTSYHQSRQETPAFIASVLAGGSDYAQLEEGLFSRYSYQYGAPQEVQEFSGIMREIRALPLLLIRLKELQPKVQELLANPPSLGDYNTFSLNQTSAMDQAWIDDIDFEQMHVDSDSESSDSSALHHVAKTFRTTGAVSFNSTFKTEMGSSIPQGWTLHDGRKGRTGEGRTEENPLQVQVIESGKIKITGDMYNFYYHLPDLKNFAGQEMRFSAKVKSTVPGTRLAYIGERGNQTNSDLHSNREGEEVLNLTFKVDSDQASLNNLYFLAGCAKVGTPPSMEISDVKLEPVGKKN